MTGIVVQTVYGESKDKTKLMFNYEDDDTIFANNSRHSVFGSTKTYFPLVLQIRAEQWGYAGGWKGQVSKEKETLERLQEKHDNMGIMLS